MASLHELRLRICTYNCRSIKNSMPDLLRLLDCHDIVCVQEHWLLPIELDSLANVHLDFYATGTSAVDISTNILIGRPYGGTAIFYRKSLCLTHSAKSIPIDEKCISGLELSSDNGPLVLLNVYMPTEYRDDHSLEKYTNVCSQLGAILMDSEAAQFMILGDFNCETGSRFYNVLSHLMSEFDLIMSDLCFLTNAFTYCSDNGINRSWIDHIITSRSVHNCIMDVNVFYDHICSDHRPLSASLKCTPSTNIDARENSSNNFVSSSQWANASPAELYSYLTELSNGLSLINIPIYLLDSTVNCTDSHYHSTIDSYYSDIMNCVKKAVECAIPKKCVHISEYNVPGWNDVVKDKYDLSREAFLEWVANEKPRAGLIFQNMVRLRAQFKLAFRYCRNHVEQLKADACAKSLNLQDSKKFWNNVNKLGNSKATKFANCINGFIGDSDIASMWKTHFQDLYNSVPDDFSKNVFQRRMAFSNNDINSLCISLYEVHNAIKHQKKAKASGPDRINMEAFIYGGGSLAEHICNLFNMCLKHSYLPDAFMQATIVPLIKCKSGNLTDINNYRAITLSNSISKILEQIFLDKIKCYAPADECQYGFKANHSTAFCTNTMKKVVNYYTSRGSHVFASFIDFSKAFDKVNYWKLFNKLLDDNIDASLVSLLSFWYSHQTIAVQWKSVFSDSFSVGNGTRQGSLLSPYLFARYIRDLIYEIFSSNIGCNLGGVFYNILAYADDIVLLAPSWAGLQHLLTLLSKGADLIDMSCNTGKTVCMIFKPVCKTKLIACDFPPFRINNTELKFVAEFKHLGHIINNDFNDNDDIKREIRNLFMRTNILKRRFAKCSLQVKRSLFIAYCMCLYDIGIWHHYSPTVFNKLQSCYNKCIKILFGYPRMYSLTTMLNELQLPTFGDLFARSLSRFHFKWVSSNNLLIQYVNILGVK